MKNIFVYIGIITATVIVGCSSLQLQPADFSWAAEEIVDVNANGMVEAKRYSVAFDVNALLAKEFEADQETAKNTKELRLIRDKAGFYYVTGKNFKNVYVLEQGEGNLTVANTITVSQNRPMDDPKFDQKNSYIELWNGNEKIQLTKGGIQTAGGKK